MDEALEVSLDQYLYEFLKELLIAFAEEFHLNSLRKLLDVVVETSKDQ